MLSQEPLVAFAGDWHGNLWWSAMKLRELAAQGVHRIYHVGDFGLWTGLPGKHFLSGVHTEAERLNQTLFIVPGNHDDYDRLSTMRTDEHGWLFLKDYPRFRFAPRGHVWLDGETRMGALGGAGSIDMRLRKPGLSWWPEEEILDVDCATLAANVAAQGWDRLDVLITHDAPAGLLRVGMRSKPAWFTPEIQSYCHTQRVRLRGAVDQVRPRWLIHGHWHEWSRDALEGTHPDLGDYTCEVVGLAADKMPRNVLLTPLVARVGFVAPKCLT